MTEWDLIYIQYNPLFSCSFIMKSSLKKSTTEGGEKKKEKKGPAY